MRHLYHIALLLWGLPRAAWRDVAAWIAKNNECDGPHVTYGPGGEYRRHWSPKIDEKG